LPTRNHKLFTKADKKKTQHRNGYKPFSDEELSKIFDPDSLLALEKPCDFWLPLLGLFTGGRISELCQLKVADIGQVDGIWTIDINDEGAAKSLKTPAAKRQIPLPPQLIQIGFLDYLDLVRPYGRTLFPYMEPDAFNHYGKTPGRRFGEYLDRLGISSPTKVFHSLRSTSNNRLKQLGVGEETRCQFVGHEHDTVNSRVYSTAHDVKFLYENVSTKLTYPQLRLDSLRFPADKQAARLSQEMAAAAKRRRASLARALRKSRSG
jgi:integrase